jgi:hypothetical protein
MSDDDSNRDDQPGGEDEQSENGDDPAETDAGHPPRGDDPFEQLGKDVAGREGDPFERLGDGPGDQRRNDPPSDGSGPEWFENPDVEESASGRGSDSPVGGTGPDGFAGAGVDEFGETGTDEFPGAGSDDAVQDYGPRGPLGERDPTEDRSQPPAEETATEDPSKMTFDVGRRNADGTTMSDPLGDIGAREGDPFERMDSAFEEQEGGPVDPDAVWQELTSAESRGSVGDAQKRTFADVSKHSYCEQCKHFSEPPDIRCNHEGTEIVEYLDMETVRVVDCPIVAERRELRKDE